MIHPCHCLADIGSDHAWLPVYAVQKGTVKKAYACDIHEGPLVSARKNIQEAGLQDSIFPVLSDGFDYVPMDCNCAVIAGMGCKTAVSILERGRNHVEKLGQILVEVNNEVPAFRKWLSEQQYTIEEEKVIQDRGHEYVCISFTSAYHPPYTEEECVVGPYLMRHPSREFHAYCLHRMEKLNFILSRRGTDAELEFQKQCFEKYSR